MTTLVITLGQVRKLIRESVLLNEIRLIRDDADEAPVYRVVEIYHHRLRHNGRAIKIPTDIPSYKIKTDVDGESASGERSLIVDTQKKLIDLDAAKWNQYFSRRRGNRSSSYIIPHADTTYNNTQAFQKILKFVMQNDSRVDGSYKIINNPKYDGMTIDDVLGSRKESDVVKGGEFKPMTFYHGTSMKRWKNVKTKGLSPGNTPETYIDLVDGYSDKNVYLTTSVSVAENYATRASIDDRADAVVLKVIVKDPTKFVVDEDSAGWLTVTNPDGELENVFFKHSTWRSWPNAEKIQAQFQTNLMKGLSKSQTIGYRGIIRPSDVSVLHSYKPAKMKQDPDEKEYFAARDKTRSTLKKGDDVKRKRKQK